ncbi:sulfite exporter TauE/SafE family protein [Flavimaricola marinus]|uniref:Probable membrane transporter protein n=1 Tax=Flavimaricola marinus TaxID=1819565 RepID=A0A238LF54_9RHOB|nr:sulfite exporter TauE/SafE family protein [Flavimaricola marinus]SMY08203.1 Sulfite exporter TauE/SafE [Flavimaricola marinus]
MYEILAFDDLTSLILAMLSVALVGLAKGGLGGAMAIMGMATLSLIVPPVQAAGILLPILLAMDAVSLWSWWKSWDVRLIRTMLPGALVGVAIGWATAAYVTDGVIRLIVGLIALLFIIRWVTAGKAARATAQPHNPVAAAIWSTISGYTSFVAHAGGPPYQIYTVPLRLPPKIFTGTSVAVFSIINFVKVIPYFALGQFDTQNLATSAALLPVALLATLAGVAIVKRLRAEVFYPIMYTMLFLLSVKLIWDGSRSVWGI